MKTEIAVIGGGASGLMAAITAKKSGKEVIILERKDRILKKVLITGNGRCNITNVNANISNYFGKNIFSVENILNKFTPQNTMDFFNGLGIVCNEENRGKVYPLSGQASSVVDALRFEAEKLGIKIETEFYVRKIEKDGFKFKIYSEDKKKIEAGRVILAAGGQSYPELGSNGSGFELAKELGHSVTKLSPSIVQLKTEKHQVKGLQGIKTDAAVTAYGDNKKICTYDGELLFTDYGISGNVVFNISFVMPLYKNVEFEIDFMEKFDYNELYEMLKERKRILSHLTMENYFNGMINKKLGQFLSKVSGIEKLSKPVKDLNDSDIRKLCTVLKKYRVKILETTGFKNAQVTAGGVSLDEVNTETLESKIVKGLYFSGEVLDVYGECGGFNLQWAWASGYIAGENAAK
ncbi:flavoprotein family protein [Leptotrichia sp. oral taxon 215 str. W9775]|uniref:NAD(P)/FAD-dependent oxidoreductase n=1 Tax=Leptotrichia sp. oral taxon 215 TaxID=712359 RepID=UPI0003ADA56A|nr:NAD(P)/FAD-dependent oxidoreductase [Leptotrichia sp. oral taxon 215]ERK68986.1 flavoprotein family protein [Leptotrichia sp. oral taxon 215 str. W9775]